MMSKATQLSMLSPVLNFELCCSDVLSHDVNLRLVFWWQVFSCLIWQILDYCYVFLPVDFFCRF